MQTSDEQRPGLRARVEAFLVEDVWAVDLVGLGWLRRQAYRAARIAYLTARGFREHGASTHASGLTYVTVLSIVPLLAMGFSVAKGFRAYDRLRADVVEPFLEALELQLVPARKLRTTLQQYEESIPWYERGWRTLKRVVGGVGKVPILGSALSNTLGGGAGGE